MHVFHGREVLRFPQKALPLAARLGQQELDGHLLPQNDVASASHERRRTFTKRPLDDVTSGDEGSLFNEAHAVWLGHGESAISTAYRFTLFRRHLAAGGEHGQGRVFD